MASTEWIDVDCRVVGRAQWPGGGQVLYVTQAARHALGLTDSAVSPGYLLRVAGEPNSDKTVYARVQGVPPVQVDSHRCEVLVSQSVWDSLSLVASEGLGRLSVCTTPFYERDFEPAASVTLRGDSRGLQELLADSSRCFLPCGSVVKAKTKANTPDESEEVEGPTLGDPLTAAASLLSGTIARVPSMLWVRWFNEDLLLRFESVTGVGHDTAVVGGGSGSDSGGEERPCVPDAFLITKSTQVKIAIGPITPQFTQTLSPSNLEATVVNAGVVGLSQPLRQLCVQLCSSFSHRKRLQAAGLQPSRGIIVSGRTGTGKSHLVSHVVAAVGLPVISISGADVFRRHEGEAEAGLLDQFERARLCEPSVVVVEGLELIAPNPESLPDTVELRLGATVASLIDGLGSAAVFVIGVARDVALIDPAITRPGRLDGSITLLAPQPADRREILSVLLQDVPLDNRESTLDAAAGMTHGYVAADLVNLCREACLCGYNRSTATPPETTTTAADESSAQTNARLKGGDRVSESTSTASSTYSRECVTEADFATALATCRPSSLAEFPSQLPRSTFDSLGGVSGQIEALQASVGLAFNQSAAFQRLGLTPPRGVLVYGPSGVGKTALVHAAAAEAGVNVIVVQGTAIVSSIVGESAASVHRLFEHARASAPCIVYMDQFEALAAKRSSGLGTNSGAGVAADRLLSTLLVELDGIESGTEGSGHVMIVATSSRPHMLDTAILRPGRLDRHILVPPPDETDRYEILLKKLEHIPHALSDADLRQLAVATHDCSGADIEGLCREAAMEALRVNIGAITIERAQFDAALKSVTRSLEGVRVWHPYDNED